jgi:S1-C subfamily serine protease
MDDEGTTSREDSQRDDPGASATEPTQPNERLPEPTEPAPVPPFPAPAGETGWSWGTEPPRPWWTAPTEPVPTISAGPRRSGRTILAAVVAAMVLLGAGVGIGWSLSNSGTTTPTTGTQAPLTLVPQSGSSNNGGAQLSLQAIANKVDPAIVDINTVIETIPTNGGAVGQVQGAGTGMILTSSGEVLTNNHVIASASSIRVTTASGSSYAATVIGADPTDDVALLQIQGASNLATVTLANSSDLSVGQRVVAIGNALGRGGTPAISEGNIAALGQAIPIANDSGGFERLSNLIQMNASISPGDSGGALVNGAGQVVGMITASQVSSRFERSSTVGFAIPVNDAVGIVNQIRSGQESSKIIIGPAGFLGVGVRNLDTDTAAQLGLNVNSGALVVGVKPNTPASQAGISGGSVITAIDGHKVSSADALGPLLHVHKPGERVQVTWVDQRGTHTATVSLITGPAV